MRSVKNIKQGQALLRKMGGDAHMKSREERMRLLPDMDDLILGTVYGEIWNRPYLDKRSRSLCMISLALTMPEIKQNLMLHLRGGLVNGLSKEEILEVILHTAFYTGFPRAALALDTAVDVFKEAGLI